MVALKVLLIIAHRGYQPIEYGHTRLALENAGIKVFIASDGGGLAYANSDKNAQQEAFKAVSVDIQLPQVVSDNYDGVFIIGGPGAIDHLDNPMVYSIVRKFAQAGKPFGAICIAPRILAHAGLLRDKKATGWDEDGALADIFKQYGAQYIRQDVVVDKNIVTATGPQAATQFGNAIVSVLKK